jgi:hypothetical protein
MQQENDKWEWVMVEWRLEGETRRNSEKTCCFAILSSTDLTCIALDWTHGSAKKSLHLIYCHFAQPVLNIGGTTG